jgi:hypothetical protein
VHRIRPYASSIHVVRRVPYACHYRSQRSVLSRVSYPPGGGSSHKYVTEGTLAISPTSCSTLFAPMTTFATNLGVISIAAGDFNGDNRTDLVITSYANSSIAIFRGYGNGSFQRQLPDLISPNPSAIAVCDFNGDHRLDVVISSFYTGILGVFLGFGNGSFASKITFPAGSSPPGIVLAQDSWATSTAMVDLTLLWY